MQAWPARVVRQTHQLRLHVDVEPDDRRLGALEHKLVLGRSTAPAPVVITTPCGERISQVLLLKRTKG